MLKSLEIIDEIIQDLEDRLEFDKLSLKGKPNEISMNKFSRKLEGNKQIKQDLEALEIIKKKNIDIKGLKHTLKGFIEGIYKTMEEVLNSYNLYFQSMEEYLTLEELLKLKQWLEDNNE